MEYRKKNRDKQGGSLKGGFLNFNTPDGYVLGLPFDVWTTGGSCSDSPNYTEKVLYDAANLPPPPRGESQISDLEVRDTGDLAGRILMSVRDVYLPCRTIPDTNHDDSGIPDL